MVLDYLGVRIFSLGSVGAVRAPPTNSIIPLLVYPVRTAPTGDYWDFLVF